jgi:hypothetical protein
LLERREYASRKTKEVAKEQKEFGIGRYVRGRKAGGRKEAERRGR